ncbi:MAG: hypothetical protein K8R36_10585 [Planctomycetales bacterium]|nr:hypothetical protein [Planctomycetales bacterium]
MITSPLPCLRLLFAHFATTVAFLLAGLSNQTFAAEALELPLAGETKIVLAGVEEGKKILTAQDAFTKSLSKFDLQVRLKRTENSTLEDWKKFAAAEVLPWNDEEIAHIKPAVTVLAEKLKKLKLPLPDKVLLVHMSGKEEADAAYTRANAIFLPSTCEEIPLPASLRERKLTNPDAPLLDCVIELKVEGQVVTVTPILYSSVESYDPAKGGPLFRYLTFRLMAVQKKDGKWQPATNAGAPILYDPKQMPSFLEQIGKNTGYIIHPDEILADNFKHLVKEEKNLPTPKIVEQMRSVLKP